MRFFPSFIIASYVMKTSCNVALRVSVRREPHRCARATCSCSRGLRGQRQTPSPSTARSNRMPSATTAPWRGTRSRRSRLAETGGGCRINCDAQRRSAWRLFVSHNSRSRWLNCTFRSQCKQLAGVGLPGERSNTPSTELHTVALCFPVHGLESRCRPDRKHHLREGSC